MKFRCYPTDHQARQLAREFDCAECDKHHDLDENGEKNILQFAKATSPTTAGQAGSNGRGEHVRPERANSPLWQCRSKRQTTRLCECLAFVFLESPCL